MFPLQHLLPHRACITQLGSPLQLLSRTVHVSRLLQLLSRTRELNMSSSVDGATQVGLPWRAATLADSDVALAGNVHSARDVNLPMVDQWTASLRDAVAIALHEPRQSVHNEAEAFIVADALAEVGRIVQLTRPDLWGDASTAMERLVVRMRLAVRMAKAFELSSTWNTQSRTSRAQHRTLRRLILHIFGSEGAAARHFELLWSAVFMGDVAVAFAALSASAWRIHHQPLRSALLDDFVTLADHDTHRTVTSVFGVDSGLMGCRGATRV